MKTINRSSGNDKKNFFVKHMYTVVLVSALLVLGAVITMTILMTQNKDQQTTTPPGPGPVQTFVLPVSEFEVLQESNLTKLVFNPTLNEWRTVNGVVFGVKKDSPVVSISDGKVVDVQNTRLQGVVVKVEHADGLVSNYMSLADNVKVTVGQDLKAGDEIGTTSASMHQYAHHKNQLYLEILQAGKYIDPLTVLPAIEQK